MKQIALIFAILALILMGFAYQFKSVQVHSTAKATVITGVNAETVNLGTALRGVHKLYGFYYLDTIGDSPSDIKLNIEGSMDNTNWFALISAAAADSWVTENTWTADTTRYATTGVGLVKFTRFIFVGGKAAQKARVGYWLNCWF